MAAKLLIIGAGPFGLAMAAQAQAQGAPYEVVGQPMSFWKEHMLAGMLLRSGCNWHLDPSERDTLTRFLGTRGQSAAEAEPLTLDLYLQYAQWFQEVKGIVVRPGRVVRLDGEDGGFAATLEDGAVMKAERVLLALGFAAFAHVPEELAARVPAERRSHSSACVAPARFRGQRVLIVGGRQSAFEGAALLAEAGAAAVHVCHRHDTPAFVASDWSWVDPLLERMGRDPGWYRGLGEGEREALNKRFWTEGRLKLEPWLGPRVRRPGITIHPRAEIQSAAAGATGVRVGLSTGAGVEVDHVLLATGYRVNMRRVAMLEAGNLGARVACRDGYPVLDEALQTTVPGLFVTSLPAARDFGLFFAFTAAVRASARIVGRALGT